MNQDTQKQLSPEEAKASLGIATYLQNQLLQNQNPPQNATQSTQEPKNESGEPKDENEAKITKLELDMTKKIDDLRKELDDKHKLELDSLRNDIKQALDAEENNEPS